MKTNNDILFCWSVLTASWSDEVATTIFEMIIDLWIVIRGFSMASALVEGYKVTQKKTTQKSKALRKTLQCDLLHAFCMFFFFFQCFVFDNLFLEFLSY